MNTRASARKTLRATRSAAVPTWKLSAELRVQVTETIGIVPFVDAGTVSEGEFLQSARFQVGAGVGLRYLTPFGPLRIDAAVPVNPEPGDPDFAIYAGVGQAF